LSAVLSQLAEWDGAAMQAGEAVRWGPLTLLFLVASMWWVKWPLIALVGAAGDASRRRRIPTAFLAASFAAALAGLTVTLLKDLASRDRPPIADPGLDPIGVVPQSTSFPSGHSATAFATAVAVGLLYPRLRTPLLALAALVAVSRVYLGVHYVSDVLVGSALGALIGLATVWALRRGRSAPTALARSRARLGTSFARWRRSPASAPTPRARPPAASP
jgi:membrane-associated phospholipid phosphatase